MNRTGIDVILICLIVVASVYVAWKNFEKGSEESELTVIPEEIIPEPQINYRYGLPVDSFNLVSGRVRTNQMLSTLMFDLGLNNIQVDEAVRKVLDIFDVKKFRAGNKYVEFRNDDSISSLSYLVYEKDPVNYIVFHFADSIRVWNGEKDIDTVRSNFAGSIQTSLWNTFTEHSANPVLANTLSDIYAWSIDFFGLQVGDSLRIIYDELFIDSVSVEIGRIHGAWFRHMGNEFWAIPFMQDGTETYFDEKGQSLRKAFLKSPVKFSRISSRFSGSRMHPVLKIRRPHYGVDYAAPVGTPVNAIGDGVVVKVGYEGQSGKMIRIKHNSVYSTAYLHLRDYAKGIATGVYVKQGDVIGYVGSTGLATGPHLDFRFYRNGHPVDPLKVEAPPVDPVREENLEDFQVVKEEVMGMIRNF